MAVTDRTTSTSNAALAALTSAALALPGVAPQAAGPAAEASMTLQFGHYQEEGSRMTADVFHQALDLPLNDWLQINASFDKDVYVGASPYFTTPRGAADAISAASNIDPFSLGAQVIAANFDVAAGVAADIGSGALPPAADVPTETFRRLINAPTLDLNADPVQHITPHPLETRNMPILGATLFHGPFALNLNTGYSDEGDFASRFGGASLSIEFNDKLSVLSGGYRFSTNDITREAVSAGGPHDHSNGGLRDFHASSRYRTLEIGLSQVIDKRTLLHLSASHTRQRGFLSNPYKLVNIKGEITAEEYNDAAFVSGGVGSTFAPYTKLEVAGFELFREVRPDSRDQWVASIGINHHFPALAGTLDLDYRYFADNWAIQSHTLDAAWHQTLSPQFSLTPRLRYYSQSAARFYAPFFLAPRADGHYSSDYRLSAFGKLNLGLEIHRQLATGLDLHLGFEYQLHRGDLALGGGSGSYADLDAYLLSAALHVDFDALRFGGNASADHSHHRAHRHAPVPAGMMMAHMLREPGAFMLGHQYRYAEWSDGYQRGSRAGVGDAELINAACRGGPCEFKAETMLMHMHMLQLMYAPTDWFNIMVMPMFSSMRMDMKPLPNSTVSNGGFHTSDGIGDTQVAGLFSLFVAGHHRAHLGLGISVPTGRVDVTFDGFVSTDSELQSFGMQLGSGTWDFKPSLTYTGDMAAWSWGAQLAATKRLQHRNKTGYRRGDDASLNLWGGYQFSPWLAATLRGSYRTMGGIKGQVNRVTPVPLGQTAQLTPLENPANTGGSFVDAGIGFSLTPASGDFRGHTLAVEWLQPVRHEYHGYQLKQEGTLSVSWHYQH